VKKKYKGYIIKVNFWGDSITPMYKYKLYKPRKYWFPKLLWTQDFHRRELKGDKISNQFCDIIEEYERSIRRWN
jgi:hypothetical protein